ncbi:Crp/Fnr family transcriptional regulator [Crocinitomix algicola]|uniref:Crp/Fnr family transcriptional regulator n=1 Tax=Crocinitomix algicola TaxID=1740263 RepID=UPI000829ECF6|nr:Crp/Fnr family transcriptional regulator [Crocinitomix algicola]
MKNYLNSFNILSSSEIDLLDELAEIKVLKKGDFFIKEGQTSHEVAFIETGVFRSYYYSSTGEEVTYCFRFANEFLSAYSSYLTASPSEECLEALTESKLIVISRETLNQLEKTSHNWTRFLKVMAEQEYITMEKRIFMLQRETAETRYANLLEKHPEYLQQIPLNYLSSYLGISPRHLSRIRKSVYK